MTYKVLIVDDSKLARMMTIKALEASQPSWCHLEAANAEEAMALANRERPELALLDLNMPGQDGLELAAALKAINPAIELAVISANTQHEVVARARDIGASFLTKPLTTSALEAFLTEIEPRLQATST